LEVAAKEVDAVGKQQLKWSSRGEATDTDAIREQQLKKWMQLESSS